MVEWHPCAGAGMPWQPCAGAGMSGSFRGTLFSRKLWRRVFGFFVGSIPPFYGYPEPVFPHHPPLLRPLTPPPLSHTFPRIALPPPIPPHPPPRRPPPPHLHPRPPLPLSSIYSLSIYLYLLSISVYIALPIYRSTYLYLISIFYHISISPCYLSIYLYLSILSFYIYYISRSIV